MGCGSGYEEFKQLPETFAGTVLAALHLLQLQAIRAPHCSSFICWERDPSINHLVKLCIIYTAMGINVYVCINGVCITGKRKPFSFWSFFLLSHPQCWIFSFLFLGVSTVFFIFLCVFRSSTMGLALLWFPNTNLWLSEGGLALVLGSSPEPCRTWTLWEGKESPEPQYRSINKY